VKQRLALVLLLAVVAVAVWLLTSRGSGAYLVSGTIETDTVRVASRQGGRVVMLGAQEGAVLNPGQLLAELAAPELTARHAQAVAALAELERGPRPEEIAAGKAEWAALQAQAEFVRHEAQRAEELFAAQTISATERDQAASRAQALAQNVAVAEQRYAVLQLGTRSEQLDAGRARVAEMAAQVQELRVTVPGAADTPTQYVLESLHVKVGDVLAPNAPVATLLLTGERWVRVYVPATWLAHIRLGQSVPVRADASPAEVTGIVEQIARQAEFTPRNVQTTGDRIRQVFAVKIRLPAEAEELRAGMSVTVPFPNVPPRPE